MTTEDFKQLAQIYGADIKRWPSEYRPVIGNLASTQFATMRQMLNDEMALDDVLNQDSIAPASSALIASIVLAAPQPKRGWAAYQSQVMGWLLSVLGITGLGLAGALAGVLFITLLSSHFMPDGLGNNEMAEIMDFSQDWR